MSVLDNFTTEQFHKVISSLDALTADRPPRRQNQDSMIIEISRLAQSLLDDDDNYDEFKNPDDPSQQSIAEPSSPLQKQHMMDTNQLSFLKTPKDHTVQEIDLQQASVIKTQKIQRNQRNERIERKERITSRLHQSRQKDPLFPSELTTTHARYGKLIRKQPTPKKKLEPSQYTRLYEQGVVRMKGRQARLLAKCIEKTKETMVEPSSAPKLTNQLYKDVASRVMGWSTTRGDLKRRELYQAEVNEKRSVDKTQYASRATLRVMTEEGSSGDIYERALQKLVRREEFVVRERQLHELKEIQEVTMAPKVNRNVEVKGDFLERLEWSMEKTKRNKALIAQNELNRTTFKPKIPITPKQAQSKIKSLWSTKNPISSENRQQPQPFSKSFNTTADITKLSFTDKSHQQHHHNQPTNKVSIKYTSELDFLIT